MAQIVKDPTKRYVTVAQVLESLSVSERTVRRWLRGDPPRLRSIRDDMGHLYIDQADVERIKAERPELANPLPERVEMLEDQVPEALAWKPAVQDLQREVADLKAQVATLLSLLETGAALDGRPRRKSHTGSDADAATRRGYPPGTLRLVKFAPPHQLSVNELKQLHWMGEIVLDVYQRTGAERNEQEWWITPDHHREVIAYYQQHNKPYQCCDFCASAS